MKFEPDTQGGGNKSELEIELTIVVSSHTILLGINLSKEHKDEKSSTLKRNGFEDLEPLWGGHQLLRLVVPESQESDIELASFKMVLKSTFRARLLLMISAPTMTVDLPLRSSLKSLGLNLETVADWLGIYLPEESSVRIGGE